jgi:hypothetical protein
MEITAQLREELDAETVAPRFATTRSRSNPHPIGCSACGATVFADKTSYDSYIRSLNYDPANQFICDDCNEAALDEHR